MSLSFWLEVTVGHLASTPALLPVQVGAAQLHQLNGLSTLWEKITLANKRINVLFICPVFPLQMTCLVTGLVWQEVTEAHSSRLKN